jgi:hypothetical protein
MAGGMRTDALACGLCGQAAFFLVRVESPAGRQHTRWRTRACSRHVVEVLLTQRTWATNSRLADSWLTVLAIDPYLPPRLAMLGAAEQGFPFYSVPITSVASDQERTTSWLT